MVYTVTQSHSNSPVYLKGRTDNVLDVIREMWLLVWHVSYSQLQIPPNPRHHLETRPKSIKYYTIRAKQYN